MSVPHRVARLGAAAALAAALAACTASATGTPGSASPPAQSAAMTAAPGGTAASRATAMSQPPASSPNAGPSTVPELPGEPPAATLAGLAAGASARGRLGSYTWNGSGTDAPWIVVPEPLGAPAGAALTTTFENLVPLRWTATWARVADGTAGDPSGGTAGSGVVAMDAPSAAGDWSLCVTAWFGPGANATYFWRLALTP